MDALQGLAGEREGHNRREGSQTATPGEGGVAPELKFVSTILLCVLYGGGYVYVKVTGKLPERHQVLLKMSLLLAMLFLAFSVYCNGETAGFSRTLSAVVAGIVVIAFAVILLL
jgi:hypothetical protein